MSIPFRLILPPDILEAVIAQALAEQPNECCGLLAGRIEAIEGDVPVGRVVARYPLLNVAASPVTYEGEARGLFAAHKEMRASELDLLAVYHSHPTSAAVPSATDLRQWFQGPDVVCVIVSLTTDPPTVRGWRLTETEYQEVSEIDGRSSVNVP